jgi:hypothetical protein
MRSMTARSSMSTAGTIAERIPDFLDQLAPLGRGNVAGLVLGDVDDLHGLAGGVLGCLDGTLVPLAAHLVRVPAVIAYELEALVAGAARSP